MSITNMRKGMQGWFRYAIYIIALVFVGGIIGLAVGGGMMRNMNEDNASSTSENIAIVGKVKIDRASYNSALEAQTAQYEQMGQQVGPFEQVQLNLSVLDRLVNQKIMVQAAASENIKVSKKDINDKIDEVIKQEIDSYRQMLLGNTKGPKTDEEFNKALAKRQKGLTVNKLTTDLRKSISRDAVKDQLLIEKLQKALEDKVDVSEKALEKSYDEVKLAQITIDIGKKKETEAEAEAKDIVKKIRSGEDFAKVAAASSNDPYAQKGGDRGIYMPRAYMEPELADVAFKINKGEVSDPIKMPQGFMIIKVLDKKSNLPKDFKDPKKHKEYLDSFAEREKSMVVNAFFENAKKNAKVTIMDPELKAHQDAKNIYMAANQAEMKANAIKAIEGYKTALSAVNGESVASARIYSQMAMIYSMLSSTMPGDDEAAKKDAAKYKAEAKNTLTEALNYTESNQLRLMLAKMNIDDKEYDKALESLQLVSDNAYADPPQIHSQVLMLAEQIKGSAKAAQLIDKEKKWMADYEKQMKAQQSADKTP